MGLPLNKISLNSEEVNWQPEMNDPQVFDNISEGEESLDVAAFIALLEQEYENRPAAFQNIFKYIVPSQDQKKNTNVSKLFIRIFLKHYKGFLTGKEG